MGKLRNRVIAEQRVYEDPKHPKTSNYDTVFPRTVTPAVIDPSSGEKLSAALTRIGTAAAGAATAASTAQATANEALATANLAKSTADGAAEAIAAVQNTISATPSQAGTLAYTGSPQKPTWNNYPVEMLTITYGTGRVTESAFTGETNAGTYKAYATPKEGYTWGDKSATEREITWSIQRATIAEVPSVTTSLVYTGEAQAPVWKNLNTTQMDFAMRFTIWLLYIVEFADWNSQAKIGYGCGNNSGTENMGYTDAMTYHTGTKLSSRTTYGLGTQYRWIEGLWDNVLDWMDGCYYNSNGMNVILNPNSFSDSANGVSIGTPSSGWPSAFSVKSVSGAFPTFIPTAASGSESTYSCDGWDFVASSPCLFVGGNYGQYTYRGLFYVYYDSVSGSGADIGCRLQELP